MWKGVYTCLMSQTCLNNVDYLMFCYLAIVWFLTIIIDYDYCVKVVRRFVFDFWEFLGEDSRYGLY